MKEGNILAEWFNGFVASNGLRVFYHRTGQGSTKPSILLLHGFTDNGLCWSEVARYLETDYDLIMTDARGHGHTEGPVNEIPTDLLAEDAAAVIQALGLGKPFVFGHSMGAMTAAALAAAYPDLVRAAILEDPPFFATTRLAPEVNQRMDDAKSRRDTFLALAPAECFALNKANNPGWSDEEILHSVQAQIEYDPELLQPRLRPNNFVWREAIAQVKCPVLLITGDVEKGGLVTPETAQEATRLCPTCKVSHISGAGHCIHRDRFAETMQSVTNFLTKH
jgi:N-formylmaleamate deformylase